MPAPPMWIAIISPGNWSCICGKVALLGLSFVLFGLSVKLFLVGD